ncbi:MAG TPA: inositol monophosphatase family protein [Syntrophales bacterium]|nr:inositol monophosphatase family protein [Syntrophales bacterium]HPC01016.1 inositol monophosphatase family protein [Syntrophales bacterium]HRS86117.1 inositol monophosphatase family protein [Syntrophales bacterium]HRV41708.1 inositol monophosphatase family protein [Syntrophales bacterium]
MTNGVSGFLTFAVETARRAGLMLKGRIDQRHLIEYKGEIDIVTEADRMSEEIIAAAVRERWPDHDLMTEESAGIDRGGEFRWIVDPLDGTTNYAHAYPVFCVSLALEHGGEIVLGVVYNPMLDEMFTAERGKGAYLNGRPIRCSKTDDLSRGLLATGFPYDIRRSRENNLNYFLAMATKAQAIRRAGSAALDLAYVAAGRFDGFWELKLKPWDMAAGCLLVTEAGGTVTDLHGGPFHIFVDGILASNGRIHEAMAEVLRNAPPWGS